MSQTWQPAKGRSSLRESPSIPSWNLRDTFRHLGHAGVPKCQSGDTESPNPLLQPSVRLRTLNQRIDISFCLLLPSKDLQCSGRLRNVLFILLLVRLLRADQRLSKGRFGFTLWLCDLKELNVHDHQRVGCLAR